MAPPAADYLVDEALVRQLLQAQFPAVGELPLSHLDSGFDNEMFRLGDELTVRLPRRRIAAQLLRSEQHWLPALAPELPLPISAPLRVGVPMFGYPWSFSILPWLTGTTADLAPPASDQTLVLAQFLRALHTTLSDVVGSAPANAVRGVALRERDEVTRERLDRLRTLPGVELPFVAVEQLWVDALAAPASSHSVWLHGDLHARNVLVRQGKLTAIIDWGDITSGDAATDLASFWMLFADVSARAQGLARYGADANLVARAKGWACSFAVMLLDSSLADDGSVEHAAHCQMGYATFANLCNESS